jgi:RNA polymerase sigma factor (sigma-70 family)
MLTVVSDGIHIERHETPCIPALHVAGQLSRMCEGWPNWRMWFLARVWWLLWFYPHLSAREAILRLAHFWPSSPKPYSEQYWAIPGKPVDVVSLKAKQRNKKLKEARPAYQFPEAKMLSRKQELELFRRWEWDGDPEAANAIFTAHVPLLIPIALEYATGALTVMDLLSAVLEGEKNENGRHRNGLPCCLENYDPAQGRISTFLIKPAEWAMASAAKRHRLLKRHEGLSLDAPIDPDDKDSDTWQDVALDDDDPVGDERHKQKRQAQLAALEQHLTEEERRVLMLRHVDGRSRRVAALMCGITADKVRYIESKAREIARG